MNKQVLLPIAVLLITLAIAALMMSNKPKLEPQKAAPSVSAVRVVTVEPKSLQLSVRSQGTVAPRTESHLIPEVSGRIVWLSPSLVSGGQFEKKEALLRIDDQDYRTALNKGTASKVKAAVEYEHANAEHKRISKLYQQQLASKSQMDQADRALRLADANVNEASINLKQTEYDLKRTVLYAPFAGRVRSENIDVGQFISRGEKIGTLYANDYVEIRVPIANAQFAYLNLNTTSGGQLPPDSAPKATVKASYANQAFQWQGAMVRTEAEIDTRSGMFYGVVRVKNNATEIQPPLVVGLFVDIDIEGREVDDIVSLPRSAIRDNNQVLIVDDENRLRFRRVKLLRIQHDEVLISEGLKQGEKVCISPLQVVVEGMSVTPLPDNTVHSTINHSAGQTTP